MVMELPRPDTKSDQQVQDGRLIGVAMGVIIERYKVSCDEALEVLRAASRGTGQTLDEVAADIVNSGIIP